MGHGFNSEGKRNASSLSHWVNWSAMGSQEEFTGTVKLPSGLQGGPTMGWVQKRGCSKLLDLPLFNMEIKKAWHVFEWARGYWKSAAEGLRWIRLFNSSLLRKWGKTNSEDSCTLSRYQHQPAVGSTSCLLRFRTYRHFPSRVYPCFSFYYIESQIPLQEPALSYVALLYNVGWVHQPH